MKTNKLSLLIIALASVTSFAMHAGTGWSKPFFDYTITETALDKAIELNDLQTVKKLVLEGAEISAINKTGYAPLHLAAFHGHHGIVQYLVEHDADVRTIDSGEYLPVKYASYYIQCYFQKVFDYVDKKIIIDFMPQNAGELIPNYFALAVIYENTDDIVTLFKKYNQADSLIRTPDFDDYIDLAKFLKKYQSHETLLFLKKEFVGLTDKNINEAPRTFKFKHKLFTTNLTDTRFYYIRYYNNQDPYLK